MTELGNTIAGSKTSYTRTADPGTTTDASAAGIRLLRRLMVINLGLVALQPVSAGFFLSGYDHAAAAHAVVAQVLQVGTLIQAVTAVVLWRRRRAPGWAAGLSVGLFAMVVLQVGLGYNRRFWLHVPLGVAIFGWLARQLNRLGA